jgi:type II secretory pathway component PulC
MPPLGPRHASVALLVTALFVTPAVTAGCGGAPPPRVRAEAPPPEPEPVATSSGVIHRAELDAVLDAGPGAFLTRLEIEPVMEGESFVAFQVAALHDEAMFSGVDLLPGDRLVSVNGQSIERPEHAMTVWSSLRVASELRVVVIRAGASRELRFAIID